LGKGIWWGGGRVKLVNISLAKKKKAPREKFKKIENREGEITPLSIRLKGEKPEGNRIRKVGENNLQFKGGGGTEKEGPGKTIRGKKVQPLLSGRKFFAGRGKKRRHKGKERKKGGKEGKKKEPQRKTCHQFREGIQVFSKGCLGFKKREKKGGGFLKGLPEN